VDVSAATLPQEYVAFSCNFFTVLTFSFKDGATHTVPITLIALHHGEISLPKVDVKALPIDGEAAMRPLALPSTETYQLHGAERVLVLPRGGRSTFALTMQESPNAVQV